MEHTTELFLQVVLGVCLALVVSSALFLLSKKFKSIPYSVLLVVIGALISPLHIEPFEAIRLSPGSVLFIFLPILLFESAFNFEFKEFKKILAPGFALASVGLLISAFIVALPLHFIFKIDFMSAFLFGSVISSTDPIAVLSIFKQLGVPRKLQLLVDGESFLNDGTSVIMFRILLPFVAGAGAQLANEDILNGFGNFLYVLIGGVIVGVVLGWLFSRVISMIKNVSSVEIALTIILAHVVFIIADHYLKVSGIIAVLAAGLVLGNYGRSKISPKVTHNMHQMWDFLVFIVTSIVFLLIGYEIHINSLIQNLDIVVIATVALLIGRAVSVYLVGGVFNIFSSKLNRIPLGWLHVTNWGGLRGALPLIVILSLPETFEYKGLFLELVIGAILFTLIVNALSIKKLINILGIDKLNITNEIEVHIAKLLLFQNIKRYLEENTGMKLVSNETYEKYDKILSDKLESTTSKIKEWLNDNNSGEYLTEFKKVLKKYAINIEKDVYSDLYKKGMIVESVYRKLKNSLEDQLDYVDADRKQFNDVEIKPKSFENLRRILNIIINGNPGLTAIEEYYMYHKARILGDEKVLHELEDLEVSDLEEISDKLINELKQQYTKLLKHNQETLAKTEKESPESTSKIEQLFVEVESHELTEKILEELGEQGRLSAKSLQNVEYKLK